MDAAHFRAADRFHTHTSLDGGRADVRTEDLHGYAGRPVAQVLPQQHGVRVDLFPRGTTGHPDTNRLAWPPVVENLRQDGFLQLTIRFGLTEEAGHVDKNVFIKSIQLHPIFLDVSHILPEIDDLVQGQAAGYAPLDGAVLVLREVHAGSAMEAIGKKDGDTVIRPIRHPEELQQAVNFAGHFSLALAMKIVEVYEPAKMPDLRSRYIDKIQQRALELRDTKIINAAWTDAAP